ncbi:MAG: hypothetical protein OHM56_02930 [Spiroplasma phoeniceum]|nr:MAG: hypothetical protein OHM57_02380 [Spiroplasma phoeniceum]UZQ32919.1 MAG: hypothetical protein OHM56_02930 [Spiroplasma phoeniceum]
MLQNDLINYETCCPECGTILKVPKPKLQLKKSDFEWQHECDVDSYQDCADKKCGNKLILKDKWKYENLEE